MGCNKIQLGPFHNVAIHFIQAASVLQPTFQAPHSLEAAAALRPLFRAHAQSLLDGFGRSIGDSQASIFYVHPRTRLVLGQKQEEAKISTRTMRQQWRLPTAPKTKQKPEYP